MLLLALAESLWKADKFQEFLCKLRILLFDSWYAVTVIHLMILDQHQLKK